MVVDDYISLLGGQYLGKTGVFKRETFPSATFSTLTQNDWPGIKLHGENTATDCLNRGTAVFCSVCTVLSQHTQEQPYCTSPLWFT